MSGSVAYLDTSAFVKLLVAEPESAALRNRLRRWPQRASATLLRTETIRALRRTGNSDLVGPARRLFTTLHLVRIDEPLLDRQEIWTRRRCARSTRYTWPQRCRSALTWARW